MNKIGFAKIGKSIKFKHNKYSPIGGDNEASCILRSLANNNPNKTFYLIGRSDFSTLSEFEKFELFPYNNVVDIWLNKKNEANEKHYNYIIEYFNNKGFELDYTVMLIGQLTYVTIPNRIFKVKDKSSSDSYASVLDMTKRYTTPIVYWLNEKKPRYIEIINDPRCTVRKPRDLFHLPEKSISQYDYYYDKKHIRSYENQEHVVSRINANYSGIETSFCVDYEYPKDVNTNRNKDFMVVLNEGKPSRYNLLKEWVLDHFDDVEIYGKWSDENVVNDDRFKRPLHISEIQKKLQDVKFTFIIPIAKGWVTSKYIEMIHAGVLPFFHPTYDMQNHINVPSILRPKSPKEFYENMNRLIENEDEYLDILDDVRKRVLKPEYYDGTYLNQKIMTSIDPYYETVNINEYKKSQLNTLENWF